MKKKYNAGGFTLIELMVVIVILGILAGLIVPRIMGRPDEARQAKARMQIESLETALKLYRLDNGNYPTTEQGLQALVEAPEVGELARKWREGGYLEKGKVPKDPWGNDFVYLSPGANGEFDLLCYGADGEEGGEGKNTDITNWDVE
ncbi:MAG: type II secretion system major pseudopilin GspG [Syntrophales bacterium]|jgi:general secretion pathway protein G|nr:type II secretion system major pseudopilin GspG [Syntrophales bacterium]MDY0045621.1 type II secretion system major pseudopilin GspG [Syntrophales bacterium]